MSLILDTLRRRRQPADALPELPRQVDDATAGSVLSDKDGAASVVGHVVMTTLFVVIFGVCGWVLIEWLLAL